MVSLSRFLEFFLLNISPLNPSLPSKSPLPIGKTDLAWGCSAPGLGLGH